jgi:hypothetical protein
MLRLLLVTGSVLAGCDPCAVPCDAGEVCVVAGTGEAGWNGDGACGPETHFYLPSAVGRDPAGRLTVMDFNNWRMRVVEDVVTTVAGSGEHRGAQAGSLPLDSPFENPIAMAWDRDDNLYIAEFHVGAVLRVRPGEALEAFLGDGFPGDDGDGGPATAAQVYAPAGVAAGEGEVYVADQGSHRVRAVDGQGFVRTVLGTGTPGSGVGELAFPERIAWDGVGSRLLVADAGNHRVLAWWPDGRVEVLAGGQGAGFAGDGGPGVEAQLDTPRGVAAGSEGSVWIGDTGNRRVRRVDADGNIETVAGSGGEVDRQRRSGDALAFPLAGPAGLWDDGDAVLIADMVAHRVLRLPFP